MGVLSWLLACSSTFADGIIRDMNGMFCSHSKSYVLRAVTSSIKDF
ncbi:MAG: hypothetical protein U0T32_15085 [Chitinophagales bacterium]